LLTDRRHELPPGGNATRYVPILRIASTLSRGNDFPSVNETFHDKVLHRITFG
jgi:hypothetical protein